MKQELVFEAPRRALPPRHLADLDAEGRAAAVSELGLPAFRAKQLAQQYYGRLLADPQQMTDLPAAVREKVADVLFPTLISAAREIECDAGPSELNSVSLAARHECQRATDCQGSSCTPFSANRPAT